MLHPGVVDSDILAGDEKLITDFILDFILLVLGDDFQVQALNRIQFDGLVLPRAVLREEVLGGLGKTTCGPRSYLLLPSSSMRMQYSSRSRVRASRTYTQLAILSFRSGLNFHTGWRNVEEHTGALNDEQFANGEVLDLCINLRFPLTTTDGGDGTGSILPGFSFIIDPTDEVRVVALSGDPEIDRLAPPPRPKSESARSREIHLAAELEGRGRTRLTFFRSWCCPEPDSPG